ncbi:MULTISPECIES: RadC family protein [Roseateles]|uniref:DNA repair protein RadC n=1 Tax=Pelomonas caseinilytica TaxID=2906763 RepID=A0ABS8X825_9BURK|nr:MULTISPECIES: DNA repair protein RadC [unclassified Roseateles]MCE4536801.1 DNA repair protein RadC [Pelomonas sp. P7]HEV6966783.1 DNA repair protein RadC [Roseateles sp.]
MSLTHLPPDARPREKLLARGPQALADAELLALLLRTGMQGLPVLQLAQSLLDRFGGWAGLLAAGVQDLAKIKGLGPAKRAEIAAVLEIARRSLAQRLAEKPAMNHVDTVKAYLRLHLGSLGQEVFAVLFLDSQLRLIAMETLFHGSLTQTTVHPREIVKRALALGAGSVILAHNHPSGHAEPSRADESLTRHLGQALALVDVKVVDHFVVGAGEVVSFAERGLL